MGNKTLQVAAIAGVLLLAQAAAGHAQLGALLHPGGLLPPYEVLAIVRSKGLEPLSRPHRHSGSYTLRAVDPRGREVQVTVDARMGRVTKVAPVVRHPASGMQANVPPRLAPDGHSPNSRIVHGTDASVPHDEDEDGVPSVAPRTLNTPRIQAVPEVTPLPRPRPQSARPSPAEPVLSKVPDGELPQKELEE
jgi:hypothetical protein